MVTFNDVQAQLEGIDSHFRFLGVTEVKKIASMLESDEQIMVCLKGWYNGATTVFCATDKRIVIVGKHDRTTQLKCIGYESLSKVHHQDNSLVPKITFHSNDKNYHFSCWRAKRLKQMHLFIKRHLIYMQEQSDATQDQLFKSRLNNKVSVPGAKRNLHTFAQRLGNASIIH